MFSGTRRRRCRGACVAALVGIVWMGPWAVARAIAQTPDGGAPDAGAPAPSLLNLPFPRTPPPNMGEYLMTPTAGGGYVFDDYRFVARVAPDGHVTFKDKHFRIETRVFDVLSEKYRRAGDHRPSLVQAIEQVLRNDPHRPISPMVEVCQQRVDMLLPGLAPCILTLTPIHIRGSFALTDELLNLTGNGWYKYEKAKFLSATFDFRVGLAAQRHLKLLREAIADLPDRLDSLWRDAAFTPREKRRIMCLLWAEVNVGDGDSRKAADVIVSWIRRRLPAGTAAAYSAPELAACAEHGKRQFTPYDPD
jgi:hypothetical protein